MGSHSPASSSQASSFSTITSVERQALNLYVYDGYVPPSQVGGEQDVAPEGQVGGVAEQVSLLVPDQAHNRPVGGDAEHLARFVAGDVQIAFGIEGQPSGKTPGRWVTSSWAPAEPSSSMGMRKIALAKVSAT